MKHLFAKLKSHPWLSIGVVYLILGAWLIPAYTYHLQTDGISYIAIAERYMQGDWYRAINAYWPPLFSWLLAPVLLLIENAVLASKIVSLVVGLFVIDAVRRLAFELEVRGYIHTLTVAAAALLALYFAVAEPGPDLLVLVPLLYYLYFALRFLATKKRVYAVYLGLTMVVACLAKSFSLPFLLVHGAVIMGLSLYREPVKKPVLIAAAMSLGIMAMGIAVWSGVLYIKYDFFTLGTSGAYNQALVGPQSPGLATGHVFYHRLIAPADQSAVSVWEDPSGLSLPAWSPFASRAHALHQLGLIKQSIYSSFLIYRRFSIFAFAILLLYILAPFSRFASARQGQSVVVIFAALSIYNAGYALLFVEQRYLWFNWLLTLLMAGVVLVLLQRAGLFKRWAEWCLMVVVLGSFVAAPSKLAWESRYTGRDVYLAAEELKKVGVQGAFASNYCPSINQAVLSVAYYTGNQYYGMVDPQANPEGVLAALRAQRVAYYFVGCDEEVNIPGAVEVAPGASKSFRVYMLLL